MSILAQAKPTFNPKPPGIVIYGEEGLGKSTFAANAPKPLFASFEDGLSAILRNDGTSPDKVDIHSYGEFSDLIRELGDSSDHDYKTLVVDTLDWLEPQIWKHICDRDGWPRIEEYDHGYGKGYVAAADEWGKTLMRLSILRNKGMAIILVAHGQIARVNDPTAGEYDKLTIKLNKRAGSKVFEWADIVLAARRRTSLRQQDDKGKRHNAADMDERLLYTVGSSAFAAKSRWALPREIPMTGPNGEHIAWDRFEQALKAAMIPPTPNSTTKDAA